MRPMAAADWPVNVTAAQLDGCQPQIAAALAAATHAAQAKTFRQLLCRRLTVAAAIWALLGVLHVVPLIGVVVGWTLFVATAAGACVLERRAGSRLLELLDA